MVLAELSGASEDGHPLSVLPRSTGLYSGVLAPEAASFFRAFAMDSGPKACADPVRLALPEGGGTGSEHAPHASIAPLLVTLTPPWPL